MSRSNLHPYQEKAARFILDRPACSGWLDLGLGKSVVALTAISDLLDSMSMRSALVVAPLRVAKSVWPEEIPKWSHVSHLTTSIMVGDVGTRVVAFHTKADIHIINVDAIVWLETYLKHRKLDRDRFPWDLIVIDEASMFKSRDTARFKAMRRMSRNAKRIIELTATPAPNSYLDLWPQYYLLDGGKRLGETVTGYRMRYFNLIDPINEKFAIKDGAKEVIEEKIADITLTLKAADYLKMPERIDITQTVKLSPEERAIYDRLERDAIAKIGDAEIEAISASALSMKLLQLANGQVYDEDRNVHAFHSRKIERLREIVDESGGEPILVAYSFISDIDRILNAFPYAEVLGRDPNTIARWNRGEIKMLLAHPKSAGHGLNLQFGGRTIVWYGLTWSLELFLQFIGRLHRQGQAKPVRVHLIITEGTIDEDVLAVILRKNASQDGLLDAMKRRVKSFMDTIQHLGDNPSAGYTRTTTGGDNETLIRTAAQAGL